MMKRILLFFLTCLTSTGISQDLQVNNTLNLGIQLNQYQNDFGSGITLTTPYFANRKIAIRLRGNVMFHEHIQEDRTTWSPYLNATLGVAALTGSIGNSIRLYSEGGVIGLFPSDEFSSESFEFGGFGLFGFEFYMNPASNYFIEIGAAGTGAKADLVPNAPIYTNGLTISTGFRFQIFNRSSAIRNKYSQYDFINMSKSEQSVYQRHKPVILGMGGGVLLGIIMGSLLDDPATGMAFGISVGAGYWYMLENEKNK